MQAEANRTTQIRNDARNSGLSPAWKGGLFHLSAGTRQEVDCSALGRGGLLAPETLASREWIFYGGRVIYERRRSSTGMNEPTSPASRVRTRVHNIAFYDRFG